MKIVNRHRDTQTHTQRKDKNIIPPWHTSYAWGINIVLGLISIHIINRY